MSRWQLLQAASAELTGVGWGRGVSAAAPTAVAIEQSQRRAAARSRTAENTGDRSGGRQTLTHFFRRAGPFEIRRCMENGNKCPARIPSRRWRMRSGFWSGTCSEQRRTPAIRARGRCLEWCCWSASRQASGRWRTVRSLQEACRWRDRLVQGKNVAVRRRVRE